MTKIEKDIRHLSSGTMATLTGIKKYDEIDRIQHAFADYAKKNERRIRDWENWSDAWDDFEDSSEIEEVLEENAAIAMIDKVAGMA
mgnify:CR=1 FL=1